VNDIRTLIGKLAVMGSHRELGRTARRLGLSAAKLFAGPGARVRETMDGIAKVAAFCEAEAGSWLDPEDIAAGKSGGFDACDLRHWLTLSKKAGVPYVPARQILSLHEDDLSLIDGEIEIPDHLRETLRRRLASSAPELLEGPPPERMSDEMRNARRAAIGSALYDAMDEIPEGWMVRSNISGSSMLKAMAGAGVIEAASDSARFSADIEVGAGWVRTGNRRRIDATDSRFIDTFAGGHKPVIHYLARPWMEAARRFEGPDPHRHGTVFAGKGSWPSEWRVFVENGRVTGVASYYAWCGEATPENAAMALEAADLAQRIVDAATGQGLSSRFMDLEILRDGASSRSLENPRIRDSLARFPRDGVNCTLDFLEVAGQGLMLLEGGPAHMPIGGGHPCAFAGFRAKPGTGVASCTEGVALRLMDHVTLADPGTWSHGDAEDRILSWDEARALAALRDADHGRDDPSP
jgi:hypothetical protein